MKTSKSFLFLLLPFFLVSKNYSNAKTDLNSFLNENVDPNRIFWTDSLHLKYADFNGKIPFGTSWAALTASSISLSYSYNHDSITSWSVQCYFEKNNSWMKTKTTEILSHEQLHFEISEIYTCLLRKKIKETKSWKASPHDIIEKYFSDINKSCDDLQNQYDSSTGHGTIPEKQKEWKSKIDSLLQEYNFFKK